MECVCFLDSDERRGQAVFKPDEVFMTTVNRPGLMLLSGSGSDPGWAFKPQAVPNDIANAMAPKVIARRVSGNRETSAFSIASLFLGDAST